MSDCLISGNASDGVDIDFGIGEVRNCRFVHSGNDGLDMSGSKLTVSNCRFENNGDKGISVGENSHPIIVNNLFYGNQIGMSIKDLSHAKVAHATFVANRLAVEAKRKKPFFGGSSAEFINSVFCENHVLLDEDYFSKGGIKLASSLADEPVDFPRCRVGRIQFRSSERGDYRVAPETLNQLNFEPATAAWLEPDANANSAGMPGIFTLPPSISAAIE
jgi:parallel beta-helix repeat protein